MADQVKTGHSKSFLTVLLLIFFFPVGLFLLWTHRSWTRNTKIVVSVIGLGIFAAIVLTSDNEKPTPKTASVAPSAATKPTPPRQTPEQIAEQARLDSISTALRIERETAERKEAARKGREEIDVDGLVLLWPTVKGTNGEYSGEITGTVENRRGRAVRFATISFNLYDASGAQIGSAIDNVSNLDAGGRWKFKALAIGEFQSFKFAEMNGY